MREWMLREELVDDDTLAGYERADRREGERIRERAYEAYLAPIHADRGRALVAIDATQIESGVDLSPTAAELRSTDEPTRRLIAATARRASAARESGPRCVSCARSWTSSTSITCSMRSRSPQTVPQRCGGRPVAGSTHPSSSGRRATGSMGSGTQARRWR